MLRQTIDMPDTEAFDPYKPKSVSTRLLLLIADLDETSALNGRELAELWGL